MNLTGSLGLNARREIVIWTAHEYLRGIGDMYDPVHSRNCGALYFSAVDTVLVYAQWL
jgi:hypothetical protein